MTGTRLLLWVVDERVDEQSGAVHFVVRLVLCRSVLVLHTPQSLHGVRGCDFGVTAGVLLLSRLGERGASKQAVATLNGRRKYFRTQIRFPSFLNMCLRSVQC